MHPRQADSGKRVMHVARSGVVNTRRKRPRRTFAVKANRVDEAVWAYALTLAGLDVSRLRVIDARTVIVVNRGRR